MMYDDERSHTRGVVTAIIAGILFATGWWLYIDGTSYGIRQEHDEVTSKAAGYTWLPPLGVTISLIMINGMEWKELRAEGYGADRATANRARLFLIGALMVAFGSIAGSVYIMTSVFLDNADAYAWGGASCFAACIFLFAATWVLRAGTAVSDEL